MSSPKCVCCGVTARDGAQLAKAHACPACVLRGAEREHIVGAPCWCVEARHAMTYLIKRGRFEYVFADSLGPALEWTDVQALAHRFSDRNQAASYVGRMPATEEHVRVVRLVPKKRGTP